jgi:hypothetical protein
MAPMNAEPKPFPVCASWRQPTTNEMTAMVDFSYVTELNQPLALRAAVIETVAAVKPFRPMADVFWQAIGVAGMMYAPYVLPPGRVRFSDIPTVLSVGVAGVAGNVPELVADLGYDPLSLVHFGYLLIKPWRRWDMSQTSPAEAERIRDAHRAMAVEAGAAMQKVANGLPAWDAVRLADEAKHPERARGDHWIFFRMAKCLPNVAPPEEARARIASIARRRGRTDLCGHPDEADDVFAAHQLARKRRNPNKRYCGIIDARGGWHADANHIFDLAELGPGRRRDKETCATDAIQAEETALAFAELALSNDDPAVLAEQRDFVARVREILFSVAKDSLDTRNIDLLLGGMRTRTERAKVLGKRESFLRSRELKMRRKAMPRASAELRSFIGQLLAA